LWIATVFSRRWRSTIIISADAKWTVGVFR
jgi:hypothetical protein